MFVLDLGLIINWEYDIPVKEKFVSSILNSICVSAYNNMKYGNVKFECRETDIKDQPKMNVSCCFLCAYYRKWNKECDD